MGQIEDETIDHHWSHSAFVFCVSGSCARIIKLIISWGIIDWRVGLIFGSFCLFFALKYWLFWFLSELNEIIPRENHRNLFLRREFSWSAIWKKANLFELVYRFSVLASILTGTLIGSI